MRPNKNKNRKKKLILENDQKNIGINNNKICKMKTVQIKTFLKFSVREKYLLNVSYTIDF